MPTDRRTTPSEKSPLQRQPFQRATLGIVAQIHSRGSGFLTEEIGQQVFPSVHTGGQGLHDQDIVIPIHNQARQSIRFSIDEAIRIGAGDDSLTQPDGLRESAPPKLFCNGFILEGQDPHADLGGRIVETSGVESSIRRHDIDHITRDQLADDLLDVTGIDPEMP